jgi:hypothetical protein
MHISNPRSKETEKEYIEFEVNLHYIVKTLTSKSWQRLALRGW